MRSFARDTGGWAQHGGNVLGLTAQIVAAYVGHSEVAAEALPALIQSVHGSLSMVETLVVSGLHNPGIPSSARFHSRRCWPTSTSGFRGERHPGALTKQVTACSRHHPLHSSYPMEQAIGHGRAATHP